LNFEKDGVPSEWVVKVKQDGVTVLTLLYLKHGAGIGA
jgi:hypothetical protein